jgi:predicted TIM-barrel fold metal-dependent hydrolase
MGAIDYWCNIFTPDGIRRCFVEPDEIAEVIAWWGMESRLVGHSTPDFVAKLDAAGVDAVLVPSARMASYETGQLLWNVAEDDVAELTREAPGRVYGLFGINPRERMAGVRRLEHCIRELGFIGAHLHAYGFGLAVDHRRYYPFYAKCVELNVPLVVQVGHSAERMPSALGRPILLDEVALDFPELKIVAAHTGWPWTEELIALAWKHRNVFIGTSAHHPRYWDPALVRFANSRGRGKVLYGTDWPVMEHADSIAAINELPLRDEARELLLEGAAKSIFDLTATHASTPHAS